jgi:two-component system, NarL family, nitrate/nitrite response regulator NarL
MRLVLCDRNRILCEALAAGLGARGHQVLAITTGARDGVAAVAEHDPDVCVLDPRLPGTDAGLAAARTIRANHPRTAVLVLSGLTDPEICREARKMGLAGFLGKNRSVDQIADALGVIIAGGAVFGPVAYAQRTARSAQHACAHLPYVLTEREREVLRRIVAGQSTPQMAREMEIATSTLRTYVRNLLIKIGAHSRLEAAALATREGLLSDVVSA